MEQPDRTYLMYNINMGGVTDKNFKAFVELPEFQKDRKRLSLIALQVSGTSGFGQA